MKRKYFLVISFLILAMFLSGCGITSPATTIDYEFFDENGGMDVYDPMFVNLLEELDTPRKIVSYMKENFTFDGHSVEYETWTPYELYLYEYGVCRDFAAFGCYFAHYHGYETYNVVLWYSDDYCHAIAVYVDENGYYNFSSNSAYFYHDCPDTGGWSLPPGSDHKVSCRSIEDVVEAFTYYVHSVIGYDVHPWNFFYWSKVKNFRCM